MKHWQFYVAVLLLAFLLLPIYEGLDEGTDNVPEGVYRIQSVKNKYCTFDGHNGQPQCYADKINDTPFEISKYNMADDVNQAMVNMQYRDEFYIKQLPNGLYVIYTWLGGRVATLCSGHTDDRVILCGTDVINEPTENDMYTIKNIGDGFYNIIHKRLNRYMYIHPGYGDILFIDRADINEKSETAKFKLIPVKLLAAPQIQTTDPNTIYDNSIAPIQSAYDKVNADYEKSNNALLNAQLTLPDVAARSGHVQNILNQLNEKHPLLEKNSSDLESRTNQTDGSQLGLQQSYHEIRDVKEPGLRGRKNQLGTNVATIQKNNIPDLNKMAELAKKKMMNTDTIHIPIIGNKDSILEYDISDLKKKTKIESNILNHHMIKGHFPDIARYKANPL